MRRRARITASSYQSELRKWTIRESTSAVCAVPLVALFLLACASARSQEYACLVAPGSRGVSGEELVATRQSDLPGAIMATRPTYLRGRDARRQEPVLYIDGIASGRFDALHEIPVADVVDVTFLSGPDATTRYGTGHVGGALLVRTQRGPAGCKP